MPRYAGYNRTYEQGSNLTQRASRKRDNYKSLQTAQRRHDYIAGAPNIGTPLTLAAEDYLGLTLIRFRRSFGAGADDPPTATSGNNFQTPDVFNGSEIRDLDAMVRLTNKSNADPITLTIYKFALSFYDTYVANLYASFPLQWNATATDEGEVFWKAIIASALGHNTIDNSKFRQHFAQRVGEVTLGLEGSGKETVELNWRGAPPKCKRSQTGMHYGYALVNDSDKNEGRTVSMDYSFRNHFIEIPSNNRLPYLA